MTTNQLDLAFSAVDYEIGRLDEIIEEARRIKNEIDGQIMNAESAREILVITKIGCMRMDAGGPDSQDTETEVS